MREAREKEPLWDIRSTAHRAGLLALVAIYLALIAAIIYGNSAGRECRRRELPLNSIR
jgi:hypothetical protein